jgi:major capsid protein E
MPQVSLLQPAILNGFIRERPFPQNLLGMALMGAPKSWPYPYWKYDIIRGNNRMTKPNVPNSEAHMRGAQGLRELTGSFIYMRDKKQFSATTLYWLRQPGDVARANAEAAVAREVAELDDAQVFFVEWAFWQGVTTGKLNVQRFDAPRVNIDYQFPASHFVIPSTLWTDLTNANPAANLATWKQTIIADSGFVPTDIYLASSTFLNYVLPNAKMQGLWSPWLKDEYMRTGTIQGLWGYDWTIYDNQYVDDWTTLGVTTSYNYIADGVLVIMAPDGDPFGALEGPSADHDALQRNPNWTGKFAKSWLEFDPSNRVHLQEWSVIPTFERPDNIIVATVK